MRISLLTMVVAGSVFWYSGTAAAQQTCGCPASSMSDSARVHQTVVLSFPGAREDLGLDSANVREIAALTDPADAATCAALRSAVERHRRGALSRTIRLAFFRSGALFFVAASDPDRIMIDGPDGGVYILGRDMKVRFRVGT